MRKRFGRRQKSPLDGAVHFKYVCWFLFIKSWSSCHHMSAGKRCNGNPNSTKM